MDDQDQTRTHTQGHENHGVHVCHQCGWPFPNLHPSAKHRRAHRKICGTIEGYKQLVSEAQTHSNASDDEHLSGDDNEIQDVDQLIVKSSDDSQMQNPNLLQSERVVDGNILKLQVQLSGSTVNPMSSSIVDMRIEESTVPHCDSNSGKAEATPAVLLENNIYAVENVGNCSLTSVNTNLNGEDQIKSDIDMIETLVSSDHTADGAINLKEKNNAEFLSVRPQDDLLLEVNSAISTNASTNGVQVESAHLIQFAASVDLKTLQERGEGNVNVFTLTSCDYRPDVVHPKSEHNDFKDHEGVVSQNSLSLHSSEALKQELDDFKGSITEENNVLLNQSQLNEKREVLSLDMHVLDGSMKKEQVSCEPMAEEMYARESIEVSSLELMVESDKRLDEIGTSMNALRTEINKSHMVDASFGSATIETTRVIRIDNTSHHEKNLMEVNDVAVDGKRRGADVQNDMDISMKTLQLHNLHSEVKPSSNVYMSDDTVEMGKHEKCHIAYARYMEKPIGKDSSSPKFASSNFGSPILPEVVMDGSARTPKGIECTNKGPLSSAQKDIKDDEINSSGRVSEECDRFVGASTDPHQAQDAELLVKAVEDLDSNHSLLSSLNTQSSAQRASAVEDAQDGEPGGELFGITAVPVLDQRGNNGVKLASSAIYTSLDSDSQCNSLEANCGSVSVFSMQSVAPAITNVEALPSNDLLASTEAGKSNLEDPKAACERQQCEKPEIFEPPSFMTLVEPGHVVGPKADASEIQNGPNQHPNSTSLQAGWFPTLTQVSNESQGRKRNEEIIAKVTNLRTGNQHKPLKSLLGEAAHSNKPKSPKLEENIVNQKHGEVSEDSGSGLTTVKSILGPETSAAQGRHTDDVKREKKKVKSRPNWIQFVCCS